MYATLLTLHSLIRWLVFISLVYTVIRSYGGLRTGRAFGPSDNTAYKLTARLAEVQLLLGVGLYFFSPVVQYFLTNFSTAVHEHEFRFFGMEHVTMMVIAVALLSVGAGKVKKKKTDKEKFKTLAIWFTIALVIIFSSIPWGFSPLTSRPYFRWF